MSFNDGLDGAGAKAATEFCGKSFGKYFFGIFVADIRVVADDDLNHPSFSSGKGHDYFSLD